MAKSFRIPYIVREVTRELEKALGIHLGVPMSAKIPPFNGEEEPKGGKVYLHFEGGRSFKVEVSTGVGHYGQYIIIERIGVSMVCWDADALIEKLTAQGVAWERSGDWEEKLRFSLSGQELWALSSEK